MYQPDKYQKNEAQYIYDFIVEHPFATFVLNGDRLLATHIPVLISGTPQNFSLYAHIANHNEQYDFLKDGAEALLIFQGAHTYISSSWYKEKDISTWDYSAIHINVKIQVQTHEELESSLEELVHKFEKAQDHPLFFKDLPKDMVEDHLPRITGFWCVPFKVEAIAKLHQGFEKDDVQSVTDHLDRKGDELSRRLSDDIKKEHGKN